MSPNDREEDRQRVMGYIEDGNELLVPRCNVEVVVLDLFAICGGCASGFMTADHLQLKSW